MPRLSRDAGPVAVVAAVGYSNPEARRRRRRDRREIPHGNRDRGDHRDRPDRRCAALDAPATVPAVAGGLRPRIRPDARADQPGGLSGVAKPAGEAYLSSLAARAAE